MPNTKILFVLKRKNSYDAYNDSHIGVSTGLYNSAYYMNKMLNESGIESNMVVVVDNNGIDREVTKFNPTHVIIEALWVVPTKFQVLSSLHPHVNWIIRLHSEIPFIANEGMSMDWLADYVQYKNVYVATNAPKIGEDLKNIIQQELNWSRKKINHKIIYLPNFYPQEYKRKSFNTCKDTVDISCFGAIRPMKNQLTQAIAAIKFANSIGKKLRFHINTGRIEQKGDPVFSNLKHLFAGLSEVGHQLINHKWAPREEFIKVCSEMDIAMQVSFSETFNIVAADTVSQGVPLVCSPEIPWASRLFTADPTDTNDIYNSLLLSYYLDRFNVYRNQHRLTKYTNKSRKIWLEYFK